MKTTLSVIKADIGSIGGHVAPSKALFETVRNHIRTRGEGLLRDHSVGFTGDDIAILMTHTHGAKHSPVHRLAWEAFLEGTRVAKARGSMAPDRIC